MYSHLLRCLSESSCLDEFAALLLLQQTHGTKSSPTGIFHFDKKSESKHFLNPQDKLLGILLI